MKAITLTQPYASLVAIGAKRVETRAWPTDHRGPLAVHAARTYRGVGGRLAFDDLLLAPPIASALDTSPLIARVGPAEVIDLPMGAIVAVCQLVDVVATEQAVQRIYARSEVRGATREIELGNYAPGRFAWFLEDVRPLEVPLPASGARGLWDVVGVCRGCGCTDVAACDEGCWWVEADLCSSCEAAVT